MVQLQENQFYKISHFLPQINCDVVYGYSIIEKRQKGRVFVDDAENPRSMILWHFCGFAFVAGYAENEDFNKCLMQLLSGKFGESQRDFILFVNNRDWNRILVETKRFNIQVAERLRFRFNNNLLSKKKIAIPVGYHVEEMDENIINRLSGHIVPSYSWHTDEAFLHNGKGYCLMEGNNIASNAFSASIGNNSIDIGIETMHDYRMRGLAAPTAYVMVKYCLDNGFEPVWGCSATNIGSCRVAKSIGFEVVDSYPMYIYRK